VSLQQIITHNNILKFFCNFAPFLIINLFNFTIMNRLIFLFVVTGFLSVSFRSEKSSRVIVYNAPAGEVLNTKYKVTADGRNVPVYIGKIGMEHKKDREKAMDDRPNFHLYYDMAGFTYFDMKRGPVKITVSVDEVIEKAIILPSSFGIIPEIKGKEIRFEIDKPQHLTVEINGEHVRSLHIFVNPEETEKPDANDPNVIYFGPGIHNIIESIELTDNQTLYVAGGAIVRCYNDTTVNPEDKEAVKKSRRSSFILSGKNVKVLGRGIIDQENVHRMQPREMFSVTGEEVKMNGIILRNSSVWTVALRGADQVTIDNIKLLGHRANSDGIDICDSWDVVVENCFIRTLDDLIVVKTFNRETGSGNILARKCILWNEVAHALSIGAELRQQVDNVTFTDCDIIGDHCREWSLRIYQCDKGVVKNIRFENIRIEEAVKFASLWINKDVWTQDPERGHIENVVFKDIMLNSPSPLTKGMEFLGFDEQHAVRNVQVENVTVRGKKITREDIVTNDYVYGVTVNGIYPKQQ
jgi:hypothetical protein